LATTVASLSCGAPSPAKSSAVDTGLPISAVARYLPLEDGTQWAYDAVDDETGETGMFITRARRLPGPRFSLMSSQGSHTLEWRADGIARADSSAYVLKSPLVAGAEWPGEGGATVRVSAHDRTIDVPAGKFVGCVETIEELRAADTRNPARRITTVYCPDVGVVLLHAEAWQSSRHLGEQATLRSVGKPVVIAPAP
jgi:hypothetical protein